ncbi:MAG: ATPase [Actinomyces sp.]|nr:MAG: ATPase [Actinomyces sp.]
MASLAELARGHTVLDADAIAHLQRLVGSWSLLADLSFSDLLLHAPVGADADTFVTLAHVRSTTGRTVHLGDPIGGRVEAAERPLMRRCLLEGRMGEELVSATPLAGDDDTVEEDIRHPAARRRRVDYVPVRAGDEVVAVLTREDEPALLRHPSQLEGTYRRLFDRLAIMIAEGSFPFDADTPAGEYREPRVGDGVLVLDREQRIEYGSPNALSALHRLGVLGPIEGSTFGQLGLDGRVVAEAFRQRRSVIAELDRGPELAVVVRCYPLSAKGALTGGLALMRDISELRHRDRLLVSKDATIREIHHRVKNNLQTISALLRLQSRRLSSPEAKAAVEQSVRRISSIALVHEALAVETGDVVDFGEVVKPVLRMVEEGLTAPERPLRIEVSGSLGRVPGEVAMPLAVVLTELVQNAIDHAAGVGSRVLVELEGRSRELVASVVDDGPGVPPGFSLDRDAGLGLTIARTFVVSDLGGSITVGPGHGEGSRTGTRVTVRIPRPGVRLALG